MCILNRSVQGNRQHFPPVSNAVFIILWGTVLTTAYHGSSQTDGCLLPPPPLYKGTGAQRPRPDRPLWTSPAGPHVSAAATITGWHYIHQD